MAAQIAAQTPLGGNCQICLRRGAGDWENKAAEDLATTLGKITGVRPPIGSTLGPNVNLVVMALTLKPQLRDRLRQVAKPHPVVTADAIVLHREGNRLYLAGSNDDSHYFAVAELMRRWGCRWYLPSPMGESRRDQLRNWLYPEAQLAQGPGERS